MRTVRLEAHGCNSVTATKMALKLADYAITEAGFGADLGAEKFLDIKCRMADLHPSAVVIVATVRALKYNGGVAKADLNNENLEALEKGIPNLLKHVSNINGDCGSCEGGDCKKETIALLTYMLQHNEHHAAELDQMADNLQKMGLDNSAKTIKEAVADFQKGNMRLGLALTLVKEEMK